MASNLFTQRSTAITAKEEHWIPLSDLMTGLMMMFMLIAVLYMVKVERESNKIKDVAILYDAMKNKLHDKLQTEFKSDLANWGAELDSKDLTIRFNSPDVLFDTGQSNLKPTFKDILNNFFPRYVAILSSSEFKDSIEEVRIEGHTSSPGVLGTTESQAYFFNMKLSQERTRSVLEYVFLLPSIQNQQNWLKAHVTANGLSSSKLVISNGIENQGKSQRVEFRVRTNADKRISEILKKTQ